MQSYDDHDLIEFKARELLRKQLFEELRRLSYKYIQTQRIECAFECEDTTLPLIHEYDPDLTTPNPSLPRAMIKPFFVPLLWNRSLATEFFAKSIVHAYDTVSQIREKSISNTSINLSYLQHVLSCARGIYKFEQERFNEVRIANRGSLRFPDPDVLEQSSRESLSLFGAITELTKISGFVRSTSNPKMIKNDIFSAIAHQMAPPIPEMQQRFTRVHQHHISDENTRDEVKWQKELLLQYLFGQRVRDNDV